MKLTLNKYTALKFALLLGTLSTLLTGCFFWRGGDRDRDDRRDHERHEEHEHHEYLRRVI